MGICILLLVASNNSEKITYDPSVPLFVRVKWSLRVFTSGLISTCVRALKGAEVYLKDDDWFPLQTVRFSSNFHSYILLIGTNDIQNIYVIHRTVSILGQKEWIFEKVDLS